MMGSDYPSSNFFFPRDVSSYFLSPPPPLAITKKKNSKGGGLYLITRTGGWRRELEEVNSLKATPKRMKE